MSLGQWYSLPTDLDYTCAHERRKDWTLKESCCMSLNEIGKGSMLCSPEFQTESKKMEQLGWSGENVSSKDQGSHRSRI